MLIHRIEAGDEMRDLGASTKLNAETAFLEHLFEIGRAVCGDWLARNFDFLGVSSTVDIGADYL